MHIVDLELRESVFVYCACVFALLSFVSRELLNQGS